MTKFSVAGLILCYNKNYALVRRAQACIAEVKRKDAKEMKQIGQSHLAMLLAATAFSLTVPAWSKESNGAPVKDNPGFSVKFEGVAEKTPPNDIDWKSRSLKGSTGNVTVYVDGNDMPTEVYVIGVADIPTTMKAVRAQQFAHRQAEVQAKSAFALWMNEVSPWCLERRTRLLSLPPEIPRARRARPARSRKMSCLRTRTPSRPRTPHGAECGAGRCSRTRRNPSASRCGAGVSGSKNSLGSSRFSHATGIPSRSSASRT